MRLLLDTHVILWWLADETRLGSKAKAEIGNPRNEIWVSVASSWEIVIKYGIGRLEMAEPPDLWLPREFESNRFRVLPITLEHSLQVQSLPPHHSDPFDRMLVAQAIREGMTILSADTKLFQYQVAILNAED